ncbi:MAG: DUF885 domain-containing protein [Ignavibacteria bacterium]|nr:DUF885 domain-containing protein [Ignavibacteria bacterium]
MHRWLLVLTTILFLVAQASGIDQGGRVLPGMIRQFEEDLGSVQRTYPLRMSGHHQERVRKFLLQWRQSLEERPVGEFSREDQIDYLLFMNYLDRSLREQELEMARLAELAPVLPFAPRLIGLEEERRRMSQVNAELAAGVLDEVDREIQKMHEAVAGGMDEGDSETAAVRVSVVVANRAAMECLNLQIMLEKWYGFYAGYDPVFTWWVEAPYKRVRRSLEAYSEFLRAEVVGVSADDKDAIVGDPIGREALVSALRYEMISYSPEELIRIAEQEYEWCETEMKKASRELGYGDNWLEAVEHVKTLHVKPGQQPELIRQLAVEAIQFLEERHLLTIPPLAKETWRIQMMSAERQKVSPFFTGGEVITVAFPLDSMQHEQKLMSLRGNNIHFSRATVQHELIPGHHLQQFMTRRYHEYRKLFWTPFWVEGWALYWEMRLWDLGFPRSAEDKVGMLFWRMHRCARIIFSFSFHLGKMTPQECVEMLVTKVGHERDNATAEVRRSFGGSYPPLYQAAYMVGALQFREMFEEYVGGRRIAEKDFHDRILEENMMPVEMVRLLLGTEPVPGRSMPEWRFYPGIE